MIKATVITRGRSGSTAIVDELGRIGGYCSLQELFSIRPDKEYYFEHWKKGRLMRHFSSEDRLARVYLRSLEAKTSRAGHKAFFWKILSHQFGERPYLSSLISSHGYRAIYLRRNVVRQVLSGIVANQRKLYNSETPIHDDKKYFVDIENFRRLLKVEERAVEVDCAFLRDNNIDFVVVYYDDFLSDRQLFYHRIFEYLELPSNILPPKTNYVVMIDDIRSTIDNFDEVNDVAIQWGSHL